MRSDFNFYPAENPQVAKFVPSRDVAEQLLSSANAANIPAADVAETLGIVASIAAKSEQGAQI